MTNSQQMTLNVSEDQAKGAKEVGIFIEPSWYDREFAYDARVRCE